MVRWALFVVVALGLAATQRPRDAAAETAMARVAVVVGVGAYQAVPPLANPPRDARAVAAALRRLGFDTTLIIDPDRATLERAVRALGDKSRTAEAAVFFYAGHALEANGRNYIIPVSAHIATLRDLPFEAVDLDLVGQQVEGRARTVVMLMDACRNNPFAAGITGAERGIRLGGGLAAPSADASGTLIAFATAPGRTAEDGAGDDSPFTTALLRHIETPGLEVRQMLGLVRHDVREATEGKQVPWESSALEGAFYFRPASATSGSVGTVIAPVAVPPPPATAPAAGTTRGNSVAVVRPPSSMTAPPPPSRAPGSPVAGARPGLATPVTPGVGGPSQGAVVEARRFEAPARSRCHVTAVHGMRRPGGTSAVMEVASDGRGCGFRIYVEIADRIPFESLSASVMPRNGTVAISNNSQIVYTPRSGFVGEDQFALISMPRGALAVRVLVRPPLAEPAG